MFSFSSLRVTISLAVLIGATAFSAWASAQDAGSSVPTQAPTPTPPVLTVQTATPEPLSAAPVTSMSNEPMIDASTSRKTLPNKPLLITGTVLLGGTYGASAILGAISDRDADKKLYYPVVGPWLDLNHRGCAANPCSNNSLDRVLLVGDGILQGIGAFGMLLSLMVPEKTTRTWYLIGNNEFVVAPSVAPYMTGLSAAGTF